MFHYVHWGHNLWWWCSGRKHCLLIYSSLTPGREGLPDSQGKASPFPRIQLTVKVVEIAIHTYSLTVSFRNEHKKQLQGSTWEESVWYGEKAVPQHRLGSACLHESQGFPLSVYLPWTWNVSLGLVSYCVLQRTNGVLPSDREAMWSRSRPYKIHEQRTRPTSSANHNWSSLADPNDE